MNSETSILKKRVYAFTADFAIITVANYFMVTAATQFIQTVFFHFPIRFQMLLIDKMEVFASISLMSFTFAYFSLFYFMTNGHTMGKSIFGIKVHNLDGSDITLNQSMARSLAYFTCAMTGSFLFALSFIRKDEKSLADVFSNSLVVSEATPKVHATEFQLSLVEEIASDDSENKAA